MAIGARHKASKWLKMAINGPFVAISRSGGSKWWISTDQGWIKAGHIWGDVLGPFPGSEMAIRGRHRASKWLKMAINGPFVAISSPGGSEMVDQHGSRLDQGRTHPGGWVGTISRVRNSHGGAP